jgi:mannose-6-phosphate isomerase-like protein (cupin superfamily)
VGTDSCQVLHFGAFISGRFHVQMNDGPEFDLGPGSVCIVPPGHDAWVVGDEPVVWIELQGASRNV